MNFGAQGPSICIHEGKILYNVINCVVFFFQGGVVISDVSDALNPGAGPVLAGGAFKQRGDGGSGNSLGARRGEGIGGRCPDSTGLRRSDALPRGVNIDLKISNKIL